MTDLFEGDFYSPEIDFPLLPSSEDERPYPEGLSPLDRLRRVTAGIAVAGALYLGGPFQLSKPIVRPHAIRVDHDGELAVPQIAKLPRRGQPIPSPVSADVLRKAERAGAFFGRVTEPPGAGGEDPDYGL